jgi:hypothetical protein
MSGFGASKLPRIGFPQLDYIGSNREDEVSLWHEAFGKRKEKKRKKGVSCAHFGSNM